MPLVAVLFSSLIEQVQGRTCTSGEEMGSKTFATCLCVGILEMAGTGLFISANGGVCLLEVQKPAPAWVIKRAAVKLKDYSSIMGCMAYAFVRVASCAYR
eukprot:186244-Amphidinium_carterae.1